ncbi:hypothetical protein VPHD148_0148 [Vibrio phage D148]
MTKIKFRSVCGYEAEIKESSGERGKRLLTHGQILYQAKASHNCLKLELTKYEVITTHEREVYIYPLESDGSIFAYPGKLVGWKSIVFNDSPDCFFEHAEDAINMVLVRKQGDSNRLIKAAEDKLCEIQQQTPSDKPYE